MTATHFLIGISTMAKYYEIRLGLRIELVLGWRTDNRICISA